MARKTVKVSDVVARGNAMLANSADDRVQGREAVASLIEGVLFDAGAYKGFRYLPGFDGDESRRAYFFDAS
jgi:hypothetical protein